MRLREERDRRPRGKTDGDEGRVARLARAAVSRRQLLAGTAKVAFATALGLVGHGVRTPPEARAAEAKRVEHIAGRTGAPGVVAVAAASSLRFLLEDLRRVLRKEDGLELRVSYGASGNLARQIMRGAPFDIFLAADEPWALAVAKGGLSEGAGLVFGLGRLALFVPDGSALVADGTLDDLGRALNDGRLMRFAIANPTHAPYGRAAKEALEAKALWQPLRPRLLIAENVAQAAQYALSGGADGGLIAASLARAPALAGRGRSALVPADWHGPLRHRALLLRKARKPARAFLAFLATPAARALLARHGFGVVHSNDGVARNND